MTRLLEINSAVWLREQDWFRQTRDLAEIPEAQIEQWLAQGFDAVWFLGVWTKGRATRDICRRIDAEQGCFTRHLPGLGEADLIGSPFSIAAYRLDPELGDPDSSLTRLREKLNRHGLKLILDFVPNHLAVDHPWVREHPDRFVQGTPYDKANNPGNYFHPEDAPERILAHGRDPYFAGWTDTVQLNVFRRATRRAMIELLGEIASLCDGLRCDMAMLVLNEVFSRTWGDLSVIDYAESEPPEFWVEAIAALREKHPDFLFLAEVYWDLEYRLIDLGFDFCYDKTLYDHLRAGRGARAMQHVEGVRGWEHQLMRFVENHDEDRAAEAFGPRHHAAAAFTAALPGGLLFYEGQFEGRRERLPVQLARRPEEKPDAETRAFYERLLGEIREPVFRRGQFRPPGIEPAWSGNPSHTGLVAAWRTHEGQRRLVVANVAGHDAQGYCRLPLEGLEGPVIEFRDRLSSVRYRRAREPLAERGLYLDLPLGGCHLFEVSEAPEGAQPDPDSD